MARKRVRKEIVMKGDLREVKPNKKRKKKSEPRTKSKKMELVAMDASAATLLPVKKRESLRSWFELYLGTQVARPEDGGSSHTFKAKVGDLKGFLEYMLSTAGSDNPDQWTKSITTGFIKKRFKRDGKRASTVNRALATLRHVSKWIHKQRPFLVGNPCKDVKNLGQADPEWLGLEDLEITRLRSAAETLIATQKRANQRPYRNYALFMLLLHTGLRQGEARSLRMNQYEVKTRRGKNGPEEVAYLKHIQRKGDNETDRVLVPGPAREALEQYFKEERGKAAGYLFQSKSGGMLAGQNVDDVMDRIAAQANSTLKDEREHIKLDAHMLRHTALRKAAEKDIRYAMKLSGHVSTKYIWRYTEPGREEFDDAVENLYD